MLQYLPGSGHISPRSFNLNSDTRSRILVVYIYLCSGVSLYPLQRPSSPSNDDAGSPFGAIHHFINPCIGACQTFNFLNGGLQCGACLCYTISRSTNVNQAWIILIVDSQAHTGFPFEVV